MSTIVGVTNPTNGSEVWELTLRIFGVSLEESRTAQELRAQFRFYILLSDSCLRPGT